MESLPAARERITDLQPLPGGGVAFSAEDPAIGALDVAGRQVLFLGRSWPLSRPWTRH